MKQILILLGVFLPIYAFSNITQVLQDEIDDCAKEMIRLQTKKGYMKNPQWNYLAGKTDAYYEILIILNKD